MPVALLTLAAMAIYLGLFTGGSGIIVLLGWRMDLPTWFTFPLAMVAGEYLRGHLFTGFPWLLLGHSQWNHPLLIQISDITGAWGVSFVVAMVNSAIFDAFARPRLKKRGLALLVPVAILVASMFYGEIKLHPSAQQRATLKVALLQPNIGVHKKFDPKLVEPNTKINLEILQNACKETPDLVVFPETTLPFPLFQDPERTLLLWDEIRSCKAPVVVGSYRWVEGDDGYYSVNRAYLIDGNGTTLGWYDKTHLVPFGEYVPLKGLLPFLTQIVGFKNGFLPGKSLNPLPFSKGKLGVLICYESIFPEIARAEVRKGAEILVNMSNDAWFGKTLAPYQHLAAAIFRAVENRHWLIRATNSGISAFVDPTGKVVKRSDLFKREVLLGYVYPLRGETIAAKLGDWLPWLSLLMVAALLVRWLAKVKGKGKEKPGED